MSVETKQPWRAAPIPESFECYSLYDPSGFDVGTMFSRGEAERLPDYLNALEACAEAVRDYKALNDRWNNTDWGNQREYDRQYRAIARRMYDALARLDALRA